MLDYSHLGVVDWDMAAIVDKFNNIFDFDSDLKSWWIDQENCSDLSGETKYLMASSLCVTTIVFTVPKDG